MSKRRIFDIDFDISSEDSPQGLDEGQAEPRRGPMATAISENAEALTERATAEAAIRAENDRLAHEYVALKRDGLIQGRIPIDRIKAEKLTRDRSTTRDPELDELIASIRAVGLSNPIHVEETETGYELIQGFRRLSAYRALHAETGATAYATIPATLQAKGAARDQLYRRMVDENLVRKDISFAEMAQLAMSYAKETATVIGEVPDAVDLLFASTGRQKRSYIRHFCHLIRILGPALKYPEVIPRATGLALLKRLDSDPRLAGQIKSVLQSRPDRDEAGELAVLRAAAEAPRGAAKTPARPQPKSTAKTTIKLNRPEGVAKCTAANGRFELQLDQDFSAIDRRRLEAAVRSFLDQLKG
ncbi:ParB N-terminal domain-containing protein [Thalassococcus sp. S3]|uniref:ParB/RepB/Spo0J family partition protein n=1 Tax=Thalassococcus sp. S3 TaxID=2017482 RepID=UPI0010242870|nr:ParB N-terminal domain-containing protein [Thalassococcus sp. S3]QBF34149.1 chromosome partitioning protein ParB [Thalassococcus sp. S3]